MWILCTFVRKVEKRPRFAPKRVAHQFILRELVAHVDELLRGGDLLSPGQEQKDIQYLV
jgi:hypothetical protein